MQNEQRTARLIAGALILLPPTASLAQPAHEDSAFGLFGAFAATEYGYFKSRMGFNNEQDWTWVEDHFRNLGAHWTRSNLQLLWDIVEPVLGGGYVWNNPMLTDPLIRRVYREGNEVHWLGVFHEGGGPIPPPPPKQQLRNPLSYPNEYQAFVRAAVERYDGDGIDDAAPGVWVKYWQAGNEIMGWQSSGRTVDDYVQFVRLLRAASRAADPQAKLVLIAPTDGGHMDPWLTQVIGALASEQAFDVIDVHHWGAAQTWRMPAIAQYRQLLDSKGLSHVQIWSCEHGTWQGQPTGQPSQTEQDQARSLVKRYVFNSNSGLDKLFWNNLMEWYQFGGNAGSIFNSMGLVTDGQGPGEDPARFNTPRIAYWTYRLLAARIDTHLATRLGLMPEVYVEGQVYGYAYRRASAARRLYFLWSEVGVRNVTFSVGTPILRLTNLIPDRYGKILEQRSLYAAGGKVRATVATDPVVIAELLLGDLNCDDAVNNFDIDAFVLALTDPAGYKAAYPDCERDLGDINGDGVVDNFDIDPFVECLSQGGCP